MKYLTETKVCTPFNHKLGIVDGDKQIVLCRLCLAPMAKWEQAFINTGQVEPVKAHNYFNKKYKVKEI